MPASLRASNGFSDMDGLASIAKVAQFLERAVNTGDVIEGSGDDLGVHAGALGRCVV